MTRHRLHICTFADSRMSPTLKRFTNSASSIHAFAGIHAFHEHQLSTQFTTSFKNVLSPKVRGFGYWCWKPEIIRMTLNLIPQDSILLYADAGCTINPGGRAKLLEYEEQAFYSHSGVLGFETKNTFNDPMLDRFRLIESHWTKGALFDILSVRNKPEITDSNQIGAGIIILRKTRNVLQLIDSWQDIFLRHFDCIDDTPSSTPNLPGFKESRHDQSAFSILAKLTGIDTRSSFEYWYPNYTDIDSSPVANWSSISDFPIWATRSIRFRLPARLSILAARITRRLEKAMNSRKFQ